MLRFSKNNNRWQSAQMFEDFKNGKLKKNKSYFAFELGELLKENNKKNGAYCPSEDVLKKYGFSYVQKLNNKEDKFAEHLYFNSSKNLYLFGQSKCGGSGYVILEDEIFNTFKSKYNNFLNMYDKKNEFLTIN